MAILDLLPILAEGVRVTVVITVLSFLFGSLLALPVSALRRSRFVVLRLVGGAYVELLRGMPPLAWLFIVYFGLPPLGVRLEPLQAAIIVFSLIAAAYLSEIYRAGLRSVPRGQLEAATALGLSGMDTYRRVIVPQAIPMVTPLAIAYFIGLITGKALSESKLGGTSLQAFLAAGVLYLLISIPVGLIGREVSRRLKPTRVGR
jgi:His/Glu/Gln/Arg/opine family amino acid ABC transporter permease subunit